MFLLSTTLLSPVVRNESRKSSKEISEQAVKKKEEDSLDRNKGWVLKSMCSFLFKLKVARLVRAGSEYRTAAGS